VLPLADDTNPRYQLLHVIESQGGEVLLADSRAAFRYLGSLDLDAARRLISIPVAPGERPHLRFEEIETWMRARGRFGRIVRDPRHHYRLRPRAGDCVIYDRHRMLYGQTTAVQWQVRSISFDVQAPLLAPTPPLPALPSTPVPVSASIDLAFDRSG
jgi:hypothetical protein